MAAGCLLLAVLGLLWLLAQLPTEGEPHGPHDGRSRGVDHRADPALADAVEAEVGKLRGVGGASATVIDRRGRRVDLTVDLTEYADIGEIRRTLEERVVVHARQAVDDPDLPIDIELRPGKARSGGRAVL